MKGINYIPHCCSSYAFLFHLSALSSHPARPPEPMPTSFRASLPHFHLHSIASNATSASSSLPRTSSAPKSNPPSASFSSPRSDASSASFELRKRANRFLPGAIARVVIFSRHAAERMPVRSALSRSCMNLSATSCSVRRAPCGPASRSWAG